MRISDKIIKFPPEFPLWKGGTDGGGDGGCVALDAGTAKYGEHLASTKFPLWKGVAPRDEVTGDVRH